jgi:hypothetical protein
LAFDPVFAFDAGFDAFVAAAFAAVYNHTRQKIRAKSTTISTFFAPVFALDVFFVGAALAVGFFAVVVAFFFTTGFLAAAFFVVFVAFLTGVAFLAVVPLPLVEAAGFLVVDAFLTAGLEFCTR